MFQNSVVVLCLRFKKFSHFIWHYWWNQHTVEKLRHKSPIDKVHIPWVHRPKTSPLQTPKN